jgi:hypothetical protein
MRPVGDQFRALEERMRERGGTARIAALLDSVAFFLEIGLPIAYDR